MTDKPEAWERLAPELPPGATEGKGGFWFNGLIWPDAEDCWSLYTHITGETRRQYAERIALERVREAAMREFAECVLEVREGEIGCGPWEVAVRTRLSRYVGSGPDICTAALACIEALGGLAELDDGEAPGEG